MPDITPPPGAAGGGGSPTGAAGGALAGTYPNPILADTPGMNPTTPPDLQGYLSWAYDPILSDGNTAALTSGVLYTVMVPWPYTSKAIANVDYYVGTVATTPTTGQNFVAIYGPTGGAALGSIASDTAFTSTTLKTVAVSVAAGSLPSTGPGAYIYVAFLQNASVGAILARRANGAGANVVNAQYRASTSARFGTFGTAQTALPSLTVGSIAAGGVALSIWVGVR